MRSRETPLWSDVLGASLALLVINLLWNEPIRHATGGGLLPLVLFNLLPSAMALFFILLRPLKRAEARSRADAGG